MKITEVKSQISVEKRDYEKPVLIEIFSISDDTFGKGFYTVNEYNSLNGGPS
jgi:hypothetical protein